MRVTLPLCEAYKPDALVLIWNLYLNGLGFAIAEANEGNRSDRVHSYRLSDNGARSRWPSLRRERDNFLPQ